MLASIPASRLNRICERFRIPLRFNLMSSRSNGSQQSGQSVVVLHIGTGDLAFNRQAQRVHGKMALAAFDLFPGIITADTTSFGRLEIGPSVKRGGGCYMMPEICEFVRSGLTSCATRLLIL